MVRDELQIQTADEHRFVIAGPSIKLAPKAAEVLTPAVHELATNASKYGAFSKPTGHVDVQWRIEVREDEDWLELLWLKTRVEFGSELPHRKGFGTELSVREAKLAGRARSPTYQALAYENPRLCGVGGASKVRPPVPAADDEGPPRIDAGSSTHPLAALPVQRVHSTHREVAKVAL